MPNQSKTGKITFNVSQLKNKSNDKIDTLHKINNNIDLYIGDCIETMKTFEKESIDLIITSPPYWGQRDYKNQKQWGNEDQVKEYIGKMEEWCIECYRILKNTGSLFLNIGDKYSKKGLQLIPERIAIAFTDNKWILRNNIIWYKPNHMPTSVKDRFCNTYEYVYFFVKDSGKYFNYSYYSNIDVLRIKQKEEPSKSNKSNEWPLVLSIEEYKNTWKSKVDKYNTKKNENYKGKFKNESINMGKSPGARQSKGISYSLQRKNKLAKNESLFINEYILKYFKLSDTTLVDIDKAFNYKDTASHWVRLDPGRSIPKPEDWMKLKELLNIEDTTHDELMTQTHYVLQNVKNNPKGKNPGDMWEINTEKCRESHYAVYPTELPSKIIKAFCPENGIVLDPFGGSGTTGLAAMRENKKCILIDCNPDFLEIINKRCN